MKKVRNYNDYLFDKIFEGVEAKETAIVISSRLTDLLFKIEHPIADRMIEFSNTTIKGDKATLIDLDDNDHGNFTYTVPNKLIDYIEKELPQYKGREETRGNLHRLSNEFGLWTKNRSPIKIGKLIGKLFPNEFKPSVVKDTEGKPTNEGEDIESFTNQVKFIRKNEEEVFKRFKIVEGDDIIKYYLLDNYDSHAGGSTLGGSCMKYERCSEYIGFYAKNNGVKLVIFMSTEEDKIMGRALLWDIEKINGQEVERKFMDRIYYIYDTDMKLFIEFARRNGWLYKSYQDMNENTTLIDTTTKTEGRFKLKTVSTFSDNNDNSYPFMDTMKYYHIDEDFLSNDKNYYKTGDVYFLESTHGDYDDLSGIYVEFYDESIEEDDLTYCALGDEYRRHNDAIYIRSLGEYATEKYIEENLVWSEYENDYLNHESAYYSEYYGDYLSEDDVIRVYNAGAGAEEDIEDVENHDYDYRLETDIGKNVIEYEDKERGTLYFDIDDKEYFVSVESIAWGDKVFVHKVWDKDRIIRFNGKFYLDDADQESKDKLLGQKRINFDEKS